MPLLLCFFIGLSIFSNQALSSQVSAWTLYKTKDQVKVEYRRLDTGLLEIRAEVRLVSNMGAFLHLLNDTDVISQWVENAERVEILDSAEAHSNIVHTYFKATWPVSQRDMVTHSVWSQDNEGVLSLQVTDLGHDYPTVAGYVRMQQVKSWWRLTPEDEGVVLIEYQGQADPAGNLPHFIVNRVALSATLKTFIKLQKMLPLYPAAYPSINEKKAAN
ncbi:START domain-containing protein [Rheinheimera sp. MMS21-TC3]|uniref:START domain-containing protein n=1 Tax=Rheinheimera sp. MMS21-TC3 TaxID=3072790 RepID=UPI0028C4123A|nr:START domain-containing protein [Rheinheimera sp. MMS21-TC3]WNO59548.1 START domain-containing protein [Rheinheimera sp. MMS21-TC3]